MISIYYNFSTIKWYYRVNEVMEIDNSNVIGGHVQRSNPLNRDAARK